MTFINPWAAALPQSTQIQEQQLSASKVRQIRKAQAVAKDGAIEGDTLEHQVESSAAISPVDDENSHEHPPQERHSENHKASDSTDDTESHLDVTG